MIRSGRICSTDSPFARRRRTVCSMSAVMTGGGRPPWIPLRAAAVSPSRVANGKVAVTQRLPDLPRMPQRRPSRSAYRRINSPVSAVGATCSATYRTTPTGTDTQSDKKAPRTGPSPPAPRTRPDLCIATAHPHPPQVRIVQEEEPLQLSPAGLPDELAVHRSLLIAQELHRHKINLEHYRPPLVAPDPGPPRLRPQRPGYAGSRTSWTTSLRRRNHGLKGGSKRAKRGGPIGVRPASRTACCSCALCLSKPDCDQPPE